MKNVFFNRELSWVEFNARVLSEGLSPDVPLLERLKFLSIVSSNFDEFFMVRVAGLKRQARKDPVKTDAGGLTAEQQVERISSRVHELVSIQHDALQNDIIPALEKEGIRYVPSRNYTEQDAKYVEHLFLNEYFSLLTPLRVDDSADFPSVPNLRTHMAFLLSPLENTRTLFSNPELFDGMEAELGAEFLSVVQIPALLPRVIWLADETGAEAGADTAGAGSGAGKTSTGAGGPTATGNAPGADKAGGSAETAGTTPGTPCRRFTLIEDVICQNQAHLFPGFATQGKLLFKITADADISVNEDAWGSFIDAMEDVLSKRQHSSPVRLETDSTAQTEEERAVSRGIRDTLQVRLHLNDRDVYHTEGNIFLLNPGGLLALAQAKGMERLQNEPWKQFFPVELEPHTPLWDVLKERDVLLSPPYQSFDPVLQFIDDASTDPNVLAIKMTLYRTSGNSRIVQALERAAARGKQVTVFVELKARFDEKRNISWATQLERAGAIVVYGIAGLKVHAKLLMVVRREEQGIMRYVHLSTGNYNETTAALYSDIALFTTNPDIATDVTVLFNTISGYSAIQKLNRLAMAPISLKKRLLQLIDREIRCSNAESPGFIMAKMNSLCHEEIIAALYRASQAHVRVLLNVRGICMLVPGVPGLSENITVVSVIDRFLEHSRVLYFQNGGHEEVYLSSADWMPRNLDRRVEVMFPVLQKDLADKLKDTLGVYFADNCKAHELRSDGTWVRKERGKHEKKHRAQEELYRAYQKAATLKNRQVPYEFVVRRDEPR